jgi:glycosyltransferase involved in cell wall biosynthesis
MKKLPAVVVLQTAWGSKFGGLNSFSTDLCRTLAETLLAHRVVCVCQDASDTDHKSVRGSGITLASVVSAPGKGLKNLTVEAVLETLKTFDIAHIDWWIGHDVITGPLALECRNAVANSHSAIFMHMSYTDYAFVKHAPEDAKDIDRRSELQKTTLASADVGFAVGPLLFDRLTAIRGSELSSRMIVPGLVDLAKKKANHDRLHAITFGRFDPSESLIKQAPLVVAGFARAFKVGVESKTVALQGARLRLVGTPTTVISQLRNLAQVEAGRVVNIEAHSFVEDSSRLRSWLHECNVCLMLSWHEGFGLSGWEAIGSGIPLIVSRNSGLYQLLDSLGGAATGCVFPVDIHGQGDGQPHEEDIEATKATLLTISSDIAKAQNNATELRHLLRFTHAFTWPNAAREVARSLGVPFTTTIMDLVAEAGGGGKKSHETYDRDEIETAWRVLSSVDSHYACGQYIQALEALDGLKCYSGLKNTPDLVLDAALKEAEICMRLNRYSPAMGLVRKITHETHDREDWPRYIRALQVENVILRDQGHYSDAVSLARKLLDVAKEHCEEKIDSVSRDLSRSLALEGLCDEAVIHGTNALESAKSKGDKIAEAKASLAMGEAYRHGRNDVSAISWYSTAQELSGRAGHVDCYLWSALGRSDSLFLMGELHTSLETLAHLQTFLQRSGHTHPLETLHIRLSLCAINIAQGMCDEADIKNILANYSDLDIVWPEEYFCLLQEHRTRIPRRF